MSFGKFTRQEIIDLISGSWSPYWGGTGGGGIPGAPLNSVQFNSGSAFSGSSNFTYLYDSNALNLSGSEHIRDGGSTLNFNPTLIPGLTIWLNSDTLTSSYSNGDTVLEWTSSVNSPTANFLNGASNPIYYTSSIVTAKGNVPAVRVDAIAGAYLLNGTAWTLFAANSASVFVVYVPKSNNYNVYSTDAGSAVNNGAWNVGALNSGSIQLFTTAAQSGYPVSMPGANSGGHIGSLYSRTGYYEFFNNGTSSGSLSTTTFDAGSGNHILGYTTEPITGTGDVDIVELIVYNNILSATDRQLVEGYLAWKFWGLGNPLSSIHPYNTTIPTYISPSTDNLLSFYNFTSSLLSYIGSDGEFYGTASWARNSLTASYITASYVIGPYGSNSVYSASYAASASYINLSTVVAPGSNEQILFNNNNFISGSSNFYFRKDLNGSELGNVELRGDNTLFNSIGFSARGSFLLGVSNVVSSSYGVTMGYGNVNRGDHSFLAGYINTSNATYGFATGQNNTLYKDGGVSLGSGNINNGKFSLTTGQGTQTNADYSFAGGNSSNTAGLHSLAYGEFVVTSASAQVAIGKYNTLNNTTDLFVIGKGNSSLRADIFAADLNTVKVSGSLSVSTGSNTQPAMQVNSDGVLVLGEYSTTPPVVIGGMIYSGSEFYLGFV
jgi:hypothetical protein